MRVITPPLGVITPVETWEGKKVSIIDHFDDYNASHKGFITPLNWDFQREKSVDN